ncbi:hypothetical protein I4J89_35855 [Actinoplanes sp. NEAU-A11]|uniref:Uncharacterized protein n=1 Tax=Actinoplanes aureus TaxID=2792083 RepID=A0A931G3A2_9ACTN|nr:hypothetical protein [Actinoplanes aureus]
MWAVGAWIVVLLAAVFWSVRNDAATVQEQRDIGHAVPELRRATGALVTAAQDERWAIRLGELRVDDCSLNPAWTGRRVSRDLTVYVPEGDAQAALDGITAGLPDTYGASVVAARGGTQLSLFADAGGFIAIDAEARSSDQVLTVRVDSGCRPPTGKVDESDPVAGPAPELFAGTLAALTATGDQREPSAEGTPGPGGESGATPGSGSEPGAGGATGSKAGPRVRAVTCPTGGTAATFEADAGTADPDDAPRGVPDGLTPVWSEPGGWAYRIGAESVVVTNQGGRLVVSVTTGCRAG